MSLSKGGGGPEDVTWRTEKGPETQLPAHSPTPPLPALETRRYSLMILSSIM